MHKVYIKIDTANRIISVNSSAFLKDTTGWIGIDEGIGDRYHHAQGNYFPLPIVTDGGAYRYKLVDGAPVECTAEEISAQEAALQPDPTPSEPESGVSEDAIWDAMAAAYNEGVQSA